MALLLPLSRAAESLEINIRAYSELQVSVSAAGTMVRVRGTLRDRQGNGLAQRPITLNFRNLDSTPNRAPLDTEPDASTQVFTERGGIFRVHQELMPGRWGVEVAFEETPNLSGERFSTTVDVRELPVALSLHVPSFVVAPSGALSVRVQATVDGVGLPEDAEVLLDDRLVGAVELDQFGRGTVSLEAPIAAGMHEVRARLSNPRYAGTEPARERLRVSQNVEVQAEIVEVLERLRRGVTVRGRVRDQLGDLQAVRVAVELFQKRSPGDLIRDADRFNKDAQPPRMTVTTDASGEFAAFFPSSELTDGLWSARVEVLPEAGASSPAVEVDAIRLDRKASRWVLNLLAVLGLLGGVGLLIQRFWQVISTYWGERKRRRASRSRAARARDEVEYLEVAALDKARPGEPAAQPSRSVLAGVVWDVWKQRPVKQAELLIFRAGDPTPLRTHRIEPAAPGQPAQLPGAFRIDDLPNGRYELTLSAPGFTPSQLDFRLPHDGRLANIRLPMIAIPLKIRRLYQSLGESLKGQDLWGTLSLGEIDDALQAVLRESAQEAHDAWDHADSSARAAFVSALKRQLRRGDTLPESAPDSRLTGEQLMALMTAVVEETYFSGRVFDNAVWQLARRLAERIREQAQGGSR